MSKKTQKYTYTITTDQYEAMKAFVETMATGPSVSIRIEPQRIESGLKRKNIRAGFF